MKLRLDPFSPNGVSVDNSTVTVAGGSSTTGGTSVTLAGEDYLTLSSQEITANPIDLDNLSATGTPSASTFLRGDNTWAAPAGSGDVTAASNFGTDNVLIRSDGITKGVQSTGITVSDTNVISGISAIGIDATNLSVVNTLVLQEALDANGNDISAVGDLETTSLSTSGTDIFVNNNLDFQTTTKAINLATPSASGDAATKGYVDGVLPTSVDDLGPSQTGNAGKFLTTDGTNASWAAVGGSGTVTSVAQTVPTGFTVAGSPITTSGTLAISYDTGYQGYTSTEATKLSGIETGADVTDTANVTAAGALMDSEVTSLSGIKTLTVPDSTTISAFGATLTDDADAGTARTTLGLGTIATQNSNNVTITGGSVTGITDITVADGGTGRSTGVTAYSLIATGTTATGAQQTLANGATTEVLVGGGASALPVWTTATGSGAPVRATSPTLTTPNLGTPSAVTLTNGTGLPVSGITSSTSTALGVGSLELGNASDTTLSRSAAGTLAVEGVDVLTTSNTKTVTNKTIAAGSNTITGLTNSNLSTTAGDLGGAWTTWSPSYTNITVGNGTATARYIQKGKTIEFFFSLTLGSTSTLTSSPAITLPATPNSTGHSDTNTILAMGTLRDNSPSNLYNVVGLYNSTPRLDIRFFGGTTYSGVVPFTAATNDVISIRGVYEAA